MVLLLVAAAALAVARASAVDTAGPRVLIGPGLWLRLPGGWHLVRSAVASGPPGRGSALQPGVIASFPAVFGRPCPCRTPNYRTCGEACQETSINDFPRAGAIVFLWEEPALRDPAELGRGFGARPAAFRVTPTDPGFGLRLSRELRRWHRRAGRACVEGPSAHPSWWLDFREAGRAFQLEVYLAPAAGAVLRTQLDAVLQGLTAAAPGADEAQRPLQR